MNPTLLKFSLSTALMLFLLVPAGAAAWDFQAKDERPIRNTAFTPEGGQLVLKTGVLGTSPTEVAAILGFEYAPNDRMSVGMNLAHAAFGIINVDTRYNFVDTGNGGLGMELGFRWIHGSWLWFLKDQAAEAASGIEIFMFPISLTGTWEPTDWIHFDLTFAYDHMAIIGNGSVSDIGYDAYIGARRIAATPRMRFFFVDRVSLNAGVILPIWEWRDLEASSEVELEEGLIGGARTSGSANKSILDRWSLSTELEIELTRYMYFRTAVDFGTFSKEVYSRPATIGVGLEWRL